MDSVLAPLVQFVAGLHPVLQFLAVFAIGLVPFLESHFGAFVGTVTGVPVVLAALAAIAGNLIACAVAVRVGDGVHRRVSDRRGEQTARTKKVMSYVDRFGVPVASLLGPIVLATSISTFIMISAGLNRRSVIIWQAVAVVAWGVAFAAIASGVLAVVA